MGGLERPKGIKLFTDFIVLSGGQTLGKVFGFLAFAYLARILDPSSYGTVEYAIGLATFSRMVVEFGLGPIGVRELAVSNERLPVMAANIPLARIFIVLGCLPIMLGAAIVSHKDATTAQLVLLYALSLAFAPWNLDWLFQARSMMTHTAVSQVLRMGVFTGGVFLWVSSPAHILRVGWIEIAAAAITAGYSIYVQQVYITPLSFKVSVAETRALLREGLPIGAAQMASAVNMFAPLFLVASIAGGEQTGWFGACHRVIVSLATFSMVYHFNLYPLLARRVVSKASDLMDVVGASFRVVSWVSIGVSLGLFVFSTDLMQVAFGPAFDAAAPAFRVLVWFLPVTLLSGHARWLLVAIKQQRLAFVAQAAGAITTVVVGLPLVAMSERLAFDRSVGAALGMLAAAVAVWVSAHRSAAAHLGSLPSSSIALRPAILAAVIALGATQVHWSAWIIAPASGILFLALGPAIDRKLLSDLKLLLRSK